MVTHLLASLGHTELILCIMPCNKMAAISQTIDKISYSWIKLSTGYILMTFLHGSFFVVAQHWLWWRFRYWHQINTFRPEENDRESAGDSLKPCWSWWRHQMETFSALLAICAGNSPVPGEYPAQRPVTRNFDVFFDLRPNTLLSKQS